MKVLEPRSDEYKRVRCEIWEKMNSEGISVASIVAVFNPVLLSNFIGVYRVQKRRATLNPEIFYKQSWKNEPDELVKREWIYSRYRQFVDSWSFNSGLKLPIIPVAHGTSFPVARAICETGFAALSTLDQGWFGKGIYFTSHICYAYPYATLTKEPSILISWVVPGNVFPVSKLCLGEAIQPGYSSHFVLTAKEGRIASPEDVPCYDELVVGQESQIVPAFIIDVQKRERKPFKKQAMSVETLDLF